MEEPEDLENNEHEELGKLILEHELPQKDEPQKQLELEQIQELRKQDVERLQEPKEGREREFDLKKCELEQTQEPELQSEFDKPHSLSKNSEPEQFFGDLEDFGEKLKEKTRIFQEEIIRRWEMEKRKQKWLGH